MNERLVKESAGLTYFIIGAMARWGIVGWPVLDDHDDVLHWRFPMEPLQEILAPEDECDWFEQLLRLEAQHMAGVAMLVDEEDEEVQVPFLTGAGVATLLTQYGTEHL